MTFSERQVRQGVRRAFRQMHLPLTRAMLRWIMREIEAETEGVTVMRNRWLHSETFLRLFMGLKFERSPEGFCVCADKPGTRYFLNDKMPPFDILGYWDARNFDSSIEAPKDIH